MIHMKDLNDGTDELFTVREYVNNLDIIKTTYVRDHTKELRSFYLFLKKYADTLGGSDFYDDLQAVYEEVGEEIAELKQKFPEEATNEAL